MPLYFAYGSCMNEKDLARTVKAKTVGTATLKNHRLAFTRYSSHRQGGVADVVKSKGDYVDGVLFEVPDFKALDIREGAPTCYKRVKVRVYPHGLNTYCYAYTYVVVSKSEREFKPSKHYAKLIWEGARVLPNDYRKALKTNLLDPSRSSSPPKNRYFYAPSKYQSKWYGQTIPF